MASASHHAEWLQLVPHTGPFLTLPVLQRVFPQQLEALETGLRGRTRDALDDWREQPRNPAVHRAWILHVLKTVLHHTDEVFVEGQSIPAGLEARQPEHGEVLRPDFVLVNPSGHAEPRKPRLLVCILPPGTDLDKPLPDRRWKASPSSRMAELCHAANVPLGLVTNGDHWLLVWAPRGETTGYASWFAHLWSEEPLTFRAFISLLRASRFFAVAPSDTLEALYTESARDQSEVTDQLGLQVRQAVQVLIQSLDRLDATHGRTLLAGTSEKELYNAALTVMMRLVFLFCAEEKGLLLLGNHLYDEHYAVSTLREQLREAADRHGEELLESRHDAWCRLLAIIRAIHGGIEHDELRLPAYGGGLFDPDRYPFLEGRAADTQWQSTPAHPLEINNRVVLHLLEALQTLETKLPDTSERQRLRLSFRALDIEQIGHVYEGLLDHTAKRALDVVLGLGGKKGEEPEILLTKLEELAGGPAVLPEDPAHNQQPLLMAADAPAAILPFPTGKGSSSYSPPEELVDYLHEATGRSKSALKKCLMDRTRVDDGKLRIACGNDDRLVARVTPFSALLREDTFGRPLVFPTGSLYVTTGSDRRSTGTHYTPRSLTEPIVQHTLEPLVYIGPAEGLPKEQWKLKSAKELLALKVCDMAMGSGAFLVQTCRYLAERLVEAWEAAESGGRGAGSGEREEGAGFENTKLSGLGSLEAQHGSGRAVLPGHTDVSQGGTVRSHEPNPTGSQLGARESGGGTRTELDQGIPESFEHSPGVIARGGNPPPAGATCGPASSGPDDAPARTLRAHQPDAVPSSPSPGTQTGLTHPLPPPAPRSPLPAQRLLVMPDGSLSTGNASEYLLPKDEGERLTLARRYVADRCLYGVDINPMAVEMAKLSLWLITLQRDRPFTFLDHALKCGDSLLGVTSVQQIENFSLRPGERQVTFATANLFRYVDEASAKRRALEDLPSNDHTQIETKNRLHAEAEAATAKVKAVADCLIALELRGLDGDAYEDQRAAEAEKVQRLIREDGDREAGGEVRGMGGKVQGASGPRIRVPAPRPSLLATHARGQLRGRHPFHWPVEFPEVFARGGFDAFVGNPPFIGGAKLETAFGSDYRAIIVARIANGLTGTRGTADLATYFLLRTEILSRREGMVGLIVTNSLGQGDAREVGLNQVLKRRHEIVRSVPSSCWPGAATVYYAMVWVFVGEWRGEHFVDGKSVSSIDASMNAAESSSPAPAKLKANENVTFEGAKLSGEGFVVPNEQARQILQRDSQNGRALKPYLTGTLLNNQPLLTPDDYIVTFFSWPLSRQSAPGDYTGPVASEFPECLEWVERNVKPQRDALPPTTPWNRKLRKFWWHFGQWRWALDDALAKVSKVLVLSRVTPHVMVDWADKTWVFSDRLTVFATDDVAMFALLQSSFHDIWSWRYGTTNLSLLSYSPAACFLTLPIPAGLTGLNRTSESYHASRREIMQTRQEGLTKTYNRFHDRGEQSADIARLRALHVELDQAVAAAYNWGDLDLGHGFHPTKQGERYTLSETARRTVLDRLLALNHQRYAEEVKAGLHEKGAKKGKVKKVGPTASQGELIESLQPELF